MSNSKIDTGIFTCDKMKLECTIKEWKGMCTCITVPALPKVWGKHTCKLVDHIIMYNYKKICIENKINKNCHLWYLLTSFLC